MTDNLSYKAGFTEQIKGNVLFVDDDGCLMIEYCAGGVRYGTAAPVDWDNLSMLEFYYYEKCHKYLLENYLPHLLDDYYSQAVLTQ